VVTVADDYTFNGFAGPVSIIGVGKKLFPLITIKFHMALPAGVSTRSA
jgi:hypothetical protein